MTETVKVTIPHETVNDETVRIISWKVVSGSRVEKTQLICEVETSKALMEIHAPEDGVIRYSAEVGDEVPVGSILCEIISGIEVDTPVVNPPGQSMIDSDVAETVSALPAARLTPLARKVAADLGIDPSVFPAGALVRRNDVLVKAGKEVSNTGTRHRSAWMRATGAFRDNRPANAPVAGVPLNWIELPRKKMVESRILGSAQASSIRSSVTVICRGAELRSRTNKPGSSGVGLTALVVFESARLLRKYPMFNAVFDQGRLGEYEEVNIGWAIDGGDGLVVPVVKHADRKNAVEIGGIMSQHVEAYVSSTLTTDDFMGGTFTISDLSADGISLFEPLLSQGQSAILGIGCDLSLGSDGSLYLTLAFDHQVAEGRSAAHFLRELSQRLEAHAALDRAADGEKFCALCQRGEKALRANKTILVRSDFPAGSVCSVCLAGF